MTKKTLKPKNPRVDYYFEKIEEGFTHVDLDLCLRFIRRARPEDIRFISELYGNGLNDYDFNSLREAVYKYEYERMLRCSNCLSAKLDFTLAIERQQFCRWNGKDIIDVTPDGCKDWVILVEARCANCGKVLFKGRAVVGELKLPIKEIWKRIHDILRKSEFFEEGEDE